MEKILNFQARSADAIVREDVAVLTFLTAIDGQDNVSVSMGVRELERLQSRIARALDAQSKQSEPE